MTDQYKNWCTNHISLFYAINMFNTRGYKKWLSLTGIQLYKTFWFTYNGIFLCPWHGFWIFIWEQFERFDFTLLIRKSWWKFDPCIKIIRMLYQTCARNLFTTNFANDTFRNGLTITQNDSTTLIACWTHPLQSSYFWIDLIKKIVFRDWQSLGWCIDSHFRYRLEKGINSLAFNSCNNEEVSLSKS